MRTRPDRRRTSARHRLPRQPASGRRRPTPSDRHHRSRAPRRRAPDPRAASMAPDRRSADPIAGAATAPGFRSRPYPHTGGTARVRIGPPGVAARQSAGGSEKRIGPGIRSQGDPLTARNPQAAVPIRPVVPGTARDASLSSFAGRRPIASIRHTPFRNPRRSLRYSNIWRGRKGLGDTFRGHGDMCGFTQLIQERSECPKRRGVPRRYLP